MQSARRSTVRFLKPVHDAADCSAIRPSDRAPNRIAVLTRLAAQYLSAQSARRSTVRFLKPVHDAAERCSRRIACGDSPVRSRAESDCCADATCGAIFACATHEKRREAILETGLRTRDAVCGDSLIRSRAESDRRTPTAFAAQYLPAQLMKNSAGRFLKPVCEHGMPFAAIRSSDRAPNRIAALTLLAAQYLPAQSARRSTVRFLKPVHDAADCLRRFARPIARRIGLPCTNSFRGA